MKSLVTALILSAIAAPVLALNLTAIGTETGITSPSADQFDRRSGRCPKHPGLIVNSNQIVAREGSACGGV